MPPNSASWVWCIANTSASARYFTWLLGEAFEGFAVLRDYVAMRFSNFRLGRHRNGIGGRLGRSGGRTCWRRAALAGPCGDPYRARQQLIVSINREANNTSL